MRETESRQPVRETEGKQPVRETEGRPPLRETERRQPLLKQGRGRGNTLALVFGNSDAARAAVGAAEQRAITPRHRASKQSPRQLD